MSTQPKTFLTPEQYLEIERNAEFRSEYYQGQMFRMAGATEQHNVITGNLGVELLPRVRGRCRVYANEMRVFIPATGLYTYPDLAVVCGERRFADAEMDTLLNPTVLVEVLSDSTEKYDRGRKFEHYRSIESLQEYVLIAQDHAHIEIFTRQANSTWLLREAARPEDSIELQSVGIQISIGNLYLDVDFVA